jgi:hypothetical protein
MAEQRAAPHSPSPILHRPFIGCGVAEGLCRRATADGDKDKGVGNRLSEGFGTIRAYALYAFLYIAKAHFEYSEVIAIPWMDANGQAC